MPKLESKTIEVKVNPLKAIIRKYHKYLVIEMISELKTKGCNEKTLIDKYRNKLPPGMAEDLEALKNGS